MYYNYKCFPANFAEDFKAIFYVNHQMAVFKLFEINEGTRKKIEPSFWCCLFIVLLVYNCCLIVSLMMTLAAWYKKDLSLFLCFIILMFDSQVRNRRAQGADRVTLPQTMTRLLRILSVTCKFCFFILWPWLTQGMSKCDALCDFVPFAQS